MKTTGALKVCYGTSNPELGKSILQKLSAENCEVQLITKKFADGEICTEFGDCVRGCDLYIIQPICRPDVNSALMELILAVDAAKRASVGSVTAIVPYYGYARQDRKARMRQPISARVVADLLSGAGIDHLIAIDLHVKQIQGFFPATVSLDTISGDFIFLEKLIELQKTKPLMIASTDAGGVTRCRDLASRLKTDLAIIDKRRYADNQAEVMNVIGDVKNKNVVVYDDICDTAGSLCNAAEALLKAGASEVYGAVTHAVLSGSACERIQKSKFTKLFLADTIPVSAEQLKQMEKVEMCSASDILAQCVLHNHRDVSFGSYLNQLQKKCAELLGKK